jgi:hypothetical protein
MPEKKGKDIAYHHPTDSPLDVFFLKELPPSSRTMGLLTLCDSLP